MTLEEAIAITRPHEPVALLIADAADWPEALKAALQVSIRRMATMTTAEKIAHLRLFARNLNARFEAADAGDEAALAAMKRDGVSAFALAIAADCAERAAIELEEQR